MGGLMDLAISVILNVLGLYKENLQKELVTLVNSIVYSS